MEYKFKEVKEIPTRKGRRGTGKYATLVTEFLDSGIAMADITEHMPISKKQLGQPLLCCLQYAIRKKGLAHKVFAIGRNKRAYIVNVELSGLKKTRCR